MENEPPADIQPARPTGPDSDEKLVALRKQLFVLLVLTIIVSGTFSVSIWRQGRQRHMELAAFKAQVAPIFAEYSQVGPRMDEFVRRIIDYGMKNPDFGPIMVKYNLATNAVRVAPNPTGAAAPPAATKPPATATPKK